VLLENIALVKSTNEIYKLDKNLEQILNAYNKFKEIYPNINYTLLEVGFCLNNASDFDILAAAIQLGIKFYGEPVEKVVEDFIGSSKVMEIKKLIEYELGELFGQTYKDIISDEFSNREFNGYKIKRVINKDSQEILFSSELFDQYVFSGIEDQVFYYYENNQWLEIEFKTQYKFTANYDCEAYTKDRKEIAKTTFVVG
jgi:hypothetical protein